MRNIFRLLCAILLCGAVSTPASAQYLSEDELTRLMAGTSIKTDTRKDNPLNITFNADGSLSARVITNRGDLLDDGKWWTKVSADGSAMFCHQFEEFTKGKKKCRSFTIEDDCRTVARYRGNGSRTKKDWIIDKPGPQAGAVIASRKASLGSCS